MTMQLSPANFHAASSNVRPLLMPSFPRTETIEETLPFTVRMASDAQALSKAVEIRHAAYKRHVPLFAESLKEPEATDAEDGVVVLLAESKLDGTALGTMRIQTNRFKPLCLEQSVALPDSLAGRTLAEATRLGVTEQRIGRVVKNVLFKAFYLYCRDSGVHSMVVAGRAPIDRQYARLMFEDVYPEKGFIPLRHAGDMPHRIMRLKVADAKAKWQDAMHPLYDFFIRTSHPDIHVGATKNNVLPFAPLKTLRLR
ncbi:MAG TPA: hypothetical protein VGU61_17100 [Noviherbaspirillum sp.]|jgi:hypothetical protein|uniref:hypothetical protein n=1 Tax=Noviherbaspirillum sp. TaxID=1926288 RepID=UPI002DDD4890|nr:hypothetical protein [Noviherbaspirillum sp.]HEV2611987.1 hypothetical protein [Noviherbaspirillum sp.]